MPGDEMGELKVSNFFRTFLKCYFTPHVVLVTSNKKCCMLGIMLTLAVEKDGQLHKKPLLLNTAQETEDGYEGKL